VRVDAAGGVFLVDTSARRVLRIDGSTGIVSTVAGNGGEDAEGDGGPATKAAIGLPKGICLDGSGNVFIAVAVDGIGNLYIADTLNNAIPRVDATTKIITRFAGTGGTGSASGDGGPANHGDSSR
jgi:hypothetical protein